MVSRGFRLLLWLFLSTLFLATVQGDTTLTGTTDAGAHYQIVVPDSWNGDLVIYNRGSGEYANPPVLGPLKDLQFAEGYAVAATSFRQTGSAYFKAKEDLLNLMGVFKENFGQPDQILIYGKSMGGLVTAMAIEDANLGNVVGALPMCGNLSGNLTSWDFALDLRLTYDAVCSDVPGAHIPGGAEGLPEVSPPTWPEIVGAINNCTGVLLPPAVRSATQTANLARILDELQVPENFLLLDMWFVTIEMSDLVHSQGKLNGKIANTNVGVTYDDPLIDSTIQRVAANPGARNRLNNHYTPTGYVGDTKIISINTDKDGLVIVENVGIYAEVMSEDNLTPLVVVEDVPSHCGFTTGELIASWEELRNWVAGGPQPTAADIQETCESLGMGPCRIDPDFVLPDPDVRFRRR